MIKATGMSSVVCRFYVSFFKIILALVASMIVASCATIFTDYDEKLLENKEYDDNIKVTEIAPVAASDKPAAPQGAVTQPAESTKKVDIVATKSKTKKTKEVIAEVKQAETKILKHEPTLEDGEGFNGRRPLVDPFTEGETLSYSVSYFGAEAGQFTTKVGPYVQVNGKKSYHFSYQARSSSVFSLFYAVDDSAEAFMDYETMVPYSYSIKARESKQVRDVKSYFNWKTMKAKLWDKKIKKGKEPEEKNLEWDLLPYSQNVFTVAFYMRAFQFSVGKELSVRVAHDGKNIIMRATVIREEKLKTSAGTFDTYVIKPQFEIAGVFKPVGDVYMWLTKDEHKYLARIESKIKIGKIVVGLEKIGP